MRCYFNTSGIRNWPEYSDSVLVITDCLKAQIFAVRDGGFTTSSDPTGDRHEYCECDRFFFFSSLSLGQCCHLKWREKRWEKRRNVSNQWLGIFNRHIRRLRCTDKNKQTGQYSQQLRSRVKETFSSISYEIETAICHCQKYFPTINM